MNEDFFKSICQLNSIPITIGKRIIDGRYKPYLSSVDDQYYSGGDVWDAKVNALQSALKKMTVQELLIKLNPR